MKWSFLLAVTLLSAVCSAQSSKTKIAAPAPTLREQALAENEIKGEQKAVASDAQVSGMLTLQDPRPEIITRSWKYFAALSAQSFQAEGVTSKEGAGTFDLGKNSQTVMPALELGVMSPSLQTKALLWKLGVRAKAGFASQGTDVTLDSGFKVDDARLNSTLFSGGLLLSMQWERLAWLSLTVSPQMGSVNYTQTSANDFATFSKQAGFNSIGYGLDIALTNKWSLFTEWTQRDLKDNKDIALQRDNFELGTKVTW
ncbi:hypothetical protein QJS83_12575 [Bdellovibrio sp. 22V]|uniref:outer membrane beta-barrel protein n=1 Tax=Bdellovibrio TaxID=958 RepID=UPI0025434FF7|nr:outer membrane beta-barrel protein [Bdellovibrio sp. 22V]WII71297.1 hypothetical protein QJS83_12575 [Bdellovibrio sp. 22V]